MQVAHFFMERHVGMCVACGALNGRWTVQIEGCGTAVLDAIGEMPCEIMAKAFAQMEGGRQLSECGEFVPDSVNYIARIISGHIFGPADVAEPLEA